MAGLKPIDALSPIYQHEAMRHVLPSQYHTDGFIFAIAAAPEIPMPEKWMPWLIQQSGNALSSSNVDSMADAFMACLRAHLSAMRDEQIALPDTCAFSDGRSNQLPEELSQWLTGLLHAHRQVEPDWQQVWNASATGDEGQRLTRSLRLFSTLADMKLAIESRNSEQAQQLEENQLLLWRQLPSQLQDYVSLAGQLALNLPNQFETFTKKR